MVLGKVGEVRVCVVFCSGRRFWVGVLTAPPPPRFWFVVCFVVVMVSDSGGFGVLSVSECDW